MKRVKTNRKLFTGAALVAILATLGVVQGMLDKAAAQAKQVPRFEVDPFWPKPMPKNYVFGQTIGLGISSDDHVWIIHRGNDPGNLDRTEISVTKEGAPPVSECCNPAPPVMEFDPAGNNVGGWGGPVAGAPYEWPESNHGIVVDHKGFVWIGGNGAGDSHILKFTRDGKFVAQYGKPEARRAPNFREAQAATATTPARPAGPYVLEQQGHGKLRPRRQDLHRSEGERRLCVRRLLEQARRGDRPRRRQDQAHLGRLRRAADRREPWPVRSGRAAAAPVPQPDALRRNVERRHGLHLRPSERSRPGVHVAGQVHCGIPHRAADPLRRLGVGHRLLEGSRSSSSSTWPTARTSTSASSTARR